MIKKIILLNLFTSILCLNCFAQINDFFLRVGTSGSLSLTRDSYFLRSKNSLSSYLGEKNRISFGKAISGGFSYSLPQNSNILVQTDINYTQRGLRIKSDEYFISAYSLKIQPFKDIKYNYLDVSVLLKKNQPVGNFEVGYGMGGTFGYFINSKIKSNDIYSIINGGTPIQTKNTAFNTNNEITIEGNNNRFDVAISGEVSLDYYLSLRTLIGLNLRVNRSLFFSHDKSKNQNTLQRYGRNSNDDVGIISRNCQLSINLRYLINPKTNEL